jgi:zinc protease
VAARYLVRSNRTVGTFVPTPTAKRAIVPATPDVADLVKDYKGGKGVARGEAFVPSPENLEKRVRRGALDCGVKTAFLAKKTRGEMVWLHLTLRFGNAESLAGRTAAAAFLGSLMRRGTARYTRQQLEDELDRLGAQLSARSGRGDLTVTLQVRRPHLPAALGLLEEVLRRPSFPTEELEVLRREWLANLEQARTTPESLAPALLYRALRPYPKDDVRYIATTEEQVGRVKALTLAQVKELYARQLGGTAGELAVVGDFDPETTGRAVEALLKG